MTREELRKAVMKLERAQTAAKVAHELAAYVGTPEQKAEALGLVTMAQRLHGAAVAALETHERGSEQ